MSVPVTLFVPVNQSDSGIYPVHTMKQYLEAFTHSDGPLFQMRDGTPVSYFFFNSRLTNAISFLGLDTKLYKSHSFTIGEATHVTMLGYSEDAIRKMGRWKSNALQHYVRLPQIRAMSNSK